MSFDDACSLTLPRLNTLLSDPEDRPKVTWMPLEAIRQQIIEQRKTKTI